MPQAIPGVCLYGSAAANQDPNSLYCIAGSFKLRSGGKVVGRGGMPALAYGAIT